MVLWPQAPRPDAASSCSCCAAAKLAPKERRKPPVDNTPPPMGLSSGKDWVSANVHEAAAAAPKYQEQEEVGRAGVGPALLHAKLPSFCPRIRTGL